jgi:hypothetical protein
MDCCSPEHRRGGGGRSARARPCPRRLPSPSPWPINRRDATRPPRRLRGEVEPRPPKSYPQLLHLVSGPPRSACRCGGRHWPPALGCQEYYSWEGLKNHIFMPCSFGLLNGASSSDKRGHKQKKKSPKRPVSIAPQTTSQYFDGTVEICCLLITSTANIL